MFKRKIVRKIFGPSKYLNGMWRIKTNELLDELLHRKNIIRFVESQRLKWLVHVERMPKERELTRSGERNPKNAQKQFLYCAF
jgi:hypothetical protein